jgi:hypothetical protein
MLNPGHGNGQFFTDPGQRLFGKPVVLTLNVQHDLEQIAGLSMVLLDYLIYFFNFHRMRSCKKMLTQLSNAGWFRLPLPKLES